MISDLLRYIFIILIKIMKKSQKNRKNLEKSSKMGSGVEMGGPLSIRSFGRGDLGFARDT